MAKGKTLELSIKIAGKMDKSLTAALKNSQSQISSFSRGISAIGTAGFAAMGALAAGTTAAIVSCTQEASKFENYMADVVKYVDNLADATGKISDKVSGNGKTYAENYELMKDAIKDLSTQIPYTQEDLTRLAAAAGQSGKALEDLVKVDGAGNITGFLRDIAMVGTAMDIEADQAGNWAAKWEQAFKMSHEEVMVLFDQINYLGANSATTAAEIAEAVNSAASLGQIGGVDVATTAALADAMLATGVASDRVGTSIKRMITNLSKGASATKAQQELWLEMGMSAEGVARSMQEDSVGTLNAIFTAVNNLPQERQVAALSTLFGQWAIEGGAKVAGNLDVFTKALEMVSDPSLYGGSMEREFAIKSNTPEAVATMLESTKTALQIDIGEAFLPAQKEFSLAMIDFMNSIRTNMPELARLAESLGKLASGGVQKLGKAMDGALPYIQRGLDYLLNNGDRAVKILGGLAAVFAGMKLAPAAEGLLSGAGSLLTGVGGTKGSGGTKGGGLLRSIKSLFTGGQKVGSAFSGAVKSNGFRSALSATLSSIFSGNGISGTAGLLNAAAGTPGMLSGYVGPGGVIKDWIENSRAGSWAGQWLSGIGSAMGQTKTGGLLGGLLGKAGGLLGGAKSGIGGLLGRAGGAIAGSKAGVAVSGLFGKAGGLFSSIAGSSGMGVLSSIWGPIAGGFGSLLAGALPVVGIISAIIAAVSLLNDKFGILDGIFNRMFGEEGPEKLESFKAFLDNLFNGDGLIQALAPLQETITGMFGTNAGAAFGGIASVLQSVMGVIGQLVTFSTQTVKPIIQDLFNFITQTVMPIILQTITAAAPYISSIISGIGSAVLTVAQIIGQAIQFLMPIIQTVLTVLMNIGQVVIPAVLAAVSAFATGISNAIAGAQMVFDGLISFITGVFTGNWQMALEGVRSIFIGVFDTLGALLKAPINAVISIINAAISGINGLGLTIPEWVPVIGGNQFAINIPQIPMLAKGGFTNGASIAGEAGTEAVISFQRAVRQDNLRTWATAGRMLGVKPQELQPIQTDSGNSGGGITFAPQIIIQGNADRSVIEEALAEARAQFEEWYLQMMRTKARTAY